MRCCFIIAAASAYKVRVFASKSVSYLRVTMEALEPAEKERSGNMKILTVSFTQSESSV